MGTLAQRDGDRAIGGGTRGKPVSAWKVGGAFAVAVAAGVLMSGCAGSSAAKRARAGASAVGDSASAAERVERRLGPVERVEVLVLPPGTVIGAGPQERGQGGGQ